jgi:hypothetical protein
VDYKGSLGHQKTNKSIQWMKEIAVISKLLGERIIYKLYRHFRDQDEADL